MIKIENLRVVKKEKPILQDINLEIGEGEKILITGESGSGKSTLIKSILFFEWFEGRIAFRNETVDEHNLPRFRNNIGYIGQILPNLSLKTKDFLHLPFGYRSHQQKSFDQKTMATLLRTLNFGDAVLDTDFSDLSGGERQRIMILQALLIDKPVYLFDEVTAALDKENISQAIKTITSDPARTIVSISHDPEWESHCRRRLEMKKGRIISDRGIG